MAKPPFILTQTFRLLLETERPERYLRPEYFRAGRNASSAMGEQDLGDWVTINRNDVLRGRVKAENGATCDLSRLVLTTDAGVGKTTAMRWLNAMLNRSSDDNAAFFFTFSKLTARPDDLIDEVLVPILLEAGSGDGSGKIDGPGGRRILETLRDQGRLVLLIDALDQAPVDGSAADALKQLLKDPRWRECRLIVSGRPHSLQRHWRGLFDDEHGSGWRFVQVDEFDENQQRLFLGKDGGGRDRYELIPAEAREILATPRVLEYLRKLSDAELMQIKTAGDVYWLSIEHLLVEGMRGSRRARQIGLAVEEETPANVQARSLAQARKLLGAIAFEMTATSNVRRDPDSGQEHQVPNFDGVRRGRFTAFRARLIERLAAPGDAALLSRDLDSLAALNDFVSQGFFDTVEGLQEIFWRNRMLQEFFTAYWLSQHGSDQDAQCLRDWIYLPQEPLSEEYYWVWRFVAEMHGDAVEPSVWARTIESVFRPGDGSAAGTKRSTEMIYRAWATLRQLSDEGEQAAREVRDCFLGEFEHEILSGNRGEQPRQIARAFCENFVEIPAGEFRMGAPPEKQGATEKIRTKWADFLDQDGEPAARAQSLVDQSLAFTPGKRGKEEREFEVRWWTDVFRDRDLDAVLTRIYPLDETPEESLQTVDAYQLARTPTLNAYFWLFIPKHGLESSYFSKEYKETSPDGDTPVIFVTWYDAWVFCRWAIGIDLVAACRANMNGSTRPRQARLGNRVIGGAMSSTLTNAMATQVSGAPRLRRNHTRTRGDWWICLGTFGNGRRTSTASNTIATSRPKVPPVCCVAARGATMRTIVARRVASTGDRRTPITSVVFAWPGLENLSPFSLFFSARRRRARSIAESDLGEVRTLR